MNRLFVLLCLISALIAAGCGGNPDDPPIKVNADKVPSPSDESGTVKMEERTFTIELTAPSPAWSVTITSVHVVGEEIWVLCQLAKKEGMAAQVMTEISDSVKVEAPEIAPTYYLIGEGGWMPKTDNPAIKLIQSKDQIAAGLKRGFQIWPTDS